MTDHDIEEIAKIGMPITAIIDSIKNGKNIQFENDGIIAIDGESVIFKVFGRKPNSSCFKDADTQMPKYKVHKNQILTKLSRNI